MKTNKLTITILFTLLTLTSCTGKIGIDSNPKDSPPQDEKPIIVSPKYLGLDSFTTTTNVPIIGDLLTQNTTLITVDTPPQNGTFTYDSSLEKFTYTPNNNFNGGDSVIIKIENLGTFILKTLTFSVEGLTCPTNYTKILADATIGTNEFCVMNFEAKQDNTRAVSTGAGLPWIGLSIGDAQSACQANGVGYDLISNKEWFAIAKLIESNPINWENQIISESSSLIRGHSDGAPYNALSVSDESNHFDQTGNTQIGNWTQRRTFYINSTDFIWDFSGNVWEFVNWETNSSQIFPSTITHCPNADWITLDQFSAQCPLITPDELLMVMPVNVNNLTQFSQDQGSGNVYTANSPTWGYVIRGGYFDQFLHAGVYGVAFDVDEFGVAFNIGFRCVFRN